MIYYSLVGKKHNIEAGSKDITFNLQTRDEIKLAYKDIASTILQGPSKNIFLIFSKTASEKVKLHELLIIKLNKIFFVF